MSELGTIISVLLTLAAFYFGLIRPILKKNKEDELREMYFLGIARMLMHSDIKKGKVVTPEESHHYRDKAEDYDEAILKKELKESSRYG